MFILLTRKNNNKKCIKIKTNYHHNNLNLHLLHCFFLFVINVNIDRTFFVISVDFNLSRDLSHTKSYSLFKFKILHYFLQCI